MVPDLAPLLAIVVLLFSFGYFAMASPSFLFVRLDIPEVWRLFRGLLNVYFRVIALVSLMAAIAFATSGLFPLSALMLCLTIATLSVRGAVINKIDAEQLRGRSGDAPALRRLRLFHWGFMVFNLVLLVSVASSIQFIF